MQVQTMSRLQCTKFLETQRLGYLACALNDRPYVVPIYYALENNAIYSFSMPGKKVDIMRANPQAAMVVEQFSDNRSWTSVMVQGHYEELSDDADLMVERERAWSLLSKYANWWEPGALKPSGAPAEDHSHPLFYRLVIDEVVGREAVNAT
ncbi:MULTISPECIES: pyridoxamine 5'-phosphate oxidase family protein [unclassified Mesorhizobium]|uniref:pyridoxamine 5'-phosphate oxidase family protein n=1 Tax=unclassified Mesorhizobium TaxID=325217 RepID=UPI0006F4F0AB|nr:MULTISPECIES: pyridoxamine 5'-phosphate oxidase family protein [unclassified Mesorhizobium]KQZ14004.1 flavin-nucleotide-binding protein [Mesorhizobium sp. Root1471]KQZ36516.1 flavin-nucleotide-binding protein [Mesorhizobium sp. Root554]MDR7035109.1 nitroimidazol reductase NimA-like FMN-containing flavoprotein (pyridoxamine 5'-phosphate oxidase superfamily) [Mesorhizobium sp. BE184]